MRNIRNFKGVTVWILLFIQPRSLINSTIHRTLTYTAASCRGTATSNGWVCSSRETWLFLRFWRNNLVAIYRATIQRPVYGSLRSCFLEVEVSDPASFVPKICPQHMSETKKHITTKQLLYVSVIGRHNYISIIR